MLTIREPISLKTQRPIQTVREDMAARIQANYGLMQSPVRKGELLHITTEPPEVYFAEGDNIQLFSQTSNEIQQEIRLDVINNLMNRICLLLQSPKQLPEAFVRPVHRDNYIYHRLFRPVFHVAHVL